MREHFYLRIHIYNRTQKIMRNYSSFLDHKNYTDLCNQIIIKNFYLLIKIHFKSILNHSMFGIKSLILFIIIICKEYLKNLILIHTFSICNIYKHAFIVMEKIQIKLEYFIHM